MRGVKSPGAHQCPTCGQTCRNAVNRRDICPDCQRPKDVRSPHCRRCASSKANPNLALAGQIQAKKRWPCEDYPQRVVAMRDAGMTFAAIGREFGRTPEAVGEVYRRHKGAAL